MKLYMLFSNETNESSPSFFDALEIEAESKAEAWNQAAELLSDEEMASAELEEI